MRNIDKIKQMTVDGEIIDRATMSRMWCARWL